MKRSIQQFRNQATSLSTPYYLGERLKHNGARSRAGASIECNPVMFQILFYHQLLISLCVVGPIPQTRLPGMPFCSVAAKMVNRMNGQ